MINEGSQESADYKTDKNGRPYPAKRVKVGVDITEASYKGNIGIMELAKFHSIASPEEKVHFSSLIKKKSLSPEHKQKEIADQIWAFVQKVTNTRLYAMEEYTKEDLQEALEIKKFNSLVKGYLAHKKASKLGGFKAMDFHQYRKTVDKVLKQPKTMEEQKIEIKLPKPRDPNHVILAAKKNAAGKHKDKKKESKQGLSKHKKDRDVSDFL